MKEIFLCLLVVGNLCSSLVWATDLFSDDPNGTYYWKALMLVTKNKKKVAENIIALLKAGDPLKDMYEDDKSIDLFFDHLFLRAAARDPQLLTYLGLFESIGISEHNAYLTDVSVAKLQDDLEQKKRDLARLKTFSYDDLTPEQKISYKIFLWKLEHEVEGESFFLYDYKINQMDGTLADLSMTLTEYHCLKNSQDAEHYCSRLQKIPKQIEQALEVLLWQHEHGIGLPRFALERVMESIATFLTSNVTENVFYRAMQSKLINVKDDEKSIFLAKVADSLKDTVYPAYRAVYQELNRLKEHTITDHGVWAFPHGDAYYAHMLKRHTTTDLTAEQIHALGLKEVAKIQAEMRSILTSQGLNDPQKSIGQLMHELAKDERHYFADTARGKEECLASFEAIAHRARKELYHLFGIAPKAPLLIKPVPQHEEAGQPGAYYAPASIDGSRPGIFFANLRSMKEMPKYHMETLTIHEAEPGHHFQISIQQEIDMPILRKLGDYNAFYEGWALYVEKLAYEQDFYSSPFSQLGHLGDELFRAVRLVVDTGIHQKRWTREEAIAYMVKETGSSYESIATEVERYFVLPGQACSYKIGQLKLLELRQRAKDVLKEAFDIKEFHTVILQLAAAPLAVVEEVVDAYITQKAELRNQK